MKILHLNSYYVTNNMYTQMYDRQEAKGHDLTVYLPAPKGTSIERPKYAHISVNHGKYDRIIFHLKHRKILKDARARFKNGNYDIVHAHSLFSNGYIAMHLKKEFGYPYIVAVRSTDFNTFFKYMVYLRPLGRKILKEAERVIVLSKPQKTELLEKYVPEKMRAELEKKIVVIPNGVDEFWHKNRRTEPKTAPKEKTVKVVTASTLDRNKNQQTVCKALSKLAEKGYHVEYHVIGRIQVKSIHDAVMAYPFVKYYPYMTKDELRELYQDMDIFVLLSHVETFGLVYVEALLQGLPVMYTKGQGFDGWFEDGEVGYPVVWNDADALAEAIEKTLADYERISGNCPKLASRFAWETFVDEYDDLMRECLEEKK